LYEPVFANSVDSTTGVKMRVLGIDPGLTRCGYAVVDGRGPSSATAISMGVIRTPATDPLPQRLAALRLEFTALIAEFRPDVVAVEQVFFQVNVRTAMSVGQASGLALAEAALAGCDVIQYTPNQVKDAVAGWGGAGKEQVQKMVQVRLKLSALPQPADAADAAALALCHLSMSPIGRQLRTVAGDSMRAKTPSRPAPAAERRARS
jgi:crossover junction endodeoxyribonuclease RuvC